MQFDAEDFFFLEKIREGLKSSFIGLAGIKDVYWQPYLSVLAKGKHKWKIMVHYIVDDYEASNDFDAVYDRETVFYDNYREVLWGFYTSYLNHYESTANLKKNMEDSGYVSVNSIQDLAGN